MTGMVNATRKRYLTSRESLQVTRFVPMKTFAQCRFCGWSVPFIYICMDVGIDQIRKFTFPESSSLTFVDVKGLSGFV